MRLGLTILLALAFGSAAAAEPLTPAQIKAIVASPDRSAADRTNDKRRHPEDILAFFAITPGITALDLSAGGGYTTELLARSIGPGGKVFGQSRPRPASPPPRPTNPEGNANPSATPAAAPPPAGPPRPSPEALADRSSRLTANNVAAAPITAVVRPFEDPVPAELSDGKLDLVTLMFNYHDLGFLQVDRDAMNKAVFKALKPGGFYIIADHSGRPGTGISESGTLHRIEEAFLRKEVEAAGFKLAGEGNFLRNPNDPRDKNTPDPPMPKDEFFLKFTKP
jgi:predicted methyltransferase